MPQDFIQSEPQRPSCPLFDILPAMNGRDSYRVLAGFAGISGFFPHPPYFSGGLRRGFTFGLSARRSFGREECIPCRTERHLLTRPERRGLRSPWGHLAPPEGSGDVAVFTSRNHLCVVSRGA